MRVTSMLPGDTTYLPQKVVEVSRETLRNFPHSKKVGNYLLGKTLGEGSFAKVKEAIHIPTGEKVAVKIVDKKRAKDDSYLRKNLRREGKILQIIRHPHIIQLLEIMETENSYYLVTELCTEGDMVDYISQRKMLPEDEVRKYIRQIVLAIDYIHRLSILHRDLKIENLLLDSNQDIKIIDFGLSNSIKTVHTKNGRKVQDFCVTQCGSPAYAAPELLGRRKYGPQIDVWSIGVNMYAMLAGNLPFTVEPFNIKTLYSKMVNGQMNPLPERISKECRDLLKKFLTPDPDRRIKLEEAIRHAWLAEGPGIPLSRSPCPNKLKVEDLDDNILKYMSEVKGFRVSEVIRYVTGNFPSPTTAMYHLLHQKLTNHYTSVRASLHTPIRPKTMVANNGLVEEKENKIPAVVLPTDEPYKQQVDRTKDSHRENDGKDTASGIIIMDLEKEPDLEEKSPVKDVYPDNTNENIADIRTSEQDYMGYQPATTPYKLRQEECQDHRSSISIHLPAVAQKYIKENLHRRKLLTRLSIRSQYQSTSPETSKENCLNKESVRIFHQKPTWPQAVDAVKAEPKRKHDNHMRREFQSDDTKKDFSHHHLKLSPFYTSVKNDNAKQQMKPKCEPYHYLHKQRGKTMTSFSLLGRFSEPNQTKLTTVAALSKTVDLEREPTKKHFLSRPSISRNMHKIKLDLSSDTVQKERISQMSSRAMSSQTGCIPSTSATPHQLELPSISPQLLHS
ncbi:hypothetical protein ACJMK2_028722 [Sinanodonta woodiana]|uniref:non-specific serine/threonine protein kinase n=1 Tax=Sinanodonta woodiana TaxID=1069815 RepID=A0ABD3XBU7_SINWO